MKKGFLFIVSILVIGSTAIWKGIDSKILNSASKETTHKVATKVGKQTIEGISSTIKSHFDDLSLILKQNKNVVDIFDNNGNLLGKLRGNQITSTPGFTTKSYNKLLDSKLIPNFTYKVESTIFSIDRLGRVNKISVSAFPKSTVKKTT